MRYGDTGPGPKGAVMLVTFELEGEEFVALNGGPNFNFTPAVSFFVNCEAQEEVDAFWDKLTEGGEPVQCGWLKDKYGLSWQIVPTVLARDAAGRGYGESKSRHAGDDANGEARHRPAEAGLQPAIAINAPKERRTAPRLTSS